MNRSSSSKGFSSECSSVSTTESGENLLVASPRSGVFRSKSIQNFIHSDDGKIVSSTRKEEISPRIPIGENSPLSYRKKFRSSSGEDNTTLTDGDIIENRIITLSSSGIFLFHLFLLVQY